jgi:hypothetical protein
VPRKNSSFDDSSIHSPDISRGESHNSPVNARGSSELVLGEDAQSKQNRRVTH